MAQEHQEGNSVDPATHSAKRKRGRPRKDDVRGSEPYNRPQRRRLDVEARENDPFLGQVVSGVLDGKFDAGYMLTVRVGEQGSVLRGVVFEPGLSVPISAANDIAPNVKMFKRDEVSLPSAWQLPCLTPIRSRKDGVLRRRQRNESAVSSKGICTGTAVEELNSRIQMHSSADSRRLPENGGNHVSGNLRQCFQSTVGDHASKDGIQNVQSTNASAECSRDIHASESGNPSIVASDSTKTVRLQEVVGEEKLTIQLSQATSESKQAAILDGRPGFTSDNLAINLGEVVGDIKLNTQMSQHTSETKQTVETLDAGPISTNNGNTAHLQEVICDAKPVTEVSPSRFSGSKQSAETSNAGPVFTDRTSGDYGQAAPLVNIQTAEHITGSVGDSKPVIEPSQTKTSEFMLSAETPDAGPVFKNGTSGDCGKAPPLITVQTSGQLTEEVADAKSVTEVSISQTKISVSNQAAETSDSGPVFNNGASDDHGKVLPPVTVQTSEQITERVADAEHATEDSQTKASKSNRSAETSDLGPVFTGGASDDYVKVSPPVTIQTSEHITDRADDLREAPHTTNLSVNESGAQHAAKIVLEHGTVEVDKRIDSSVGQESQVHLQPLEPESNKPVELSSEQLANNASAGKVTPEQLQSDLASPSGGSNEVCSTATSETTTASFQGADVNGGS